MKIILHILCLIVDVSKNAVRGCWDFLVSNSFIFSYASHSASPPAGGGPCGQDTGLFNRPLHCLPPRGLALNLWEEDAGHCVRAVRTAAAPGV